jgi:hypothetical protein
MLRVTVRILALLLLAFGVALCLADSGSKLLPVIRSSAVPTIPRKESHQRKSHAAVPPVTQPLPSSPPAKPSAIHKLELSAYGWVKHIPLSKYLMPDGVPISIVACMFVVMSFSIPKSAATSHALQKGIAMQLPQIWDERQISLDIERHRSNPGMLSTYFDGIVTRFVTGQNLQTVEVRTKFLQSFNKYAEVARESYKWKRMIDGGRATIEEDLADIQARVRLEKAKSELDEVNGDHLLAELQKEAKRLEVMVEIARKKKQLEDIAKPDPPPPLPPQPGPSASEIRAMEKAELDGSEKKVREEIRIVTIDPTLSDEQRRRKLNALEERLAEIHEKQVRLL